MLKKSLISLFTIIAIIAQAGITYANPNAMTPLQVLPQNLDMVLNLDLKQSPEITNTFKQFTSNENESIKELIDIGKRNEIIAGFRGVDKNNEIRDMFMSVKVSNGQFKTITNSYGSSSGLEALGEIVDYKCTKTKDVCFAKLGTYFYLTNRASNMDELVMNFTKGERDVLNQNKEYMNSQNLKVFGSYISAYLDFKWINKEILKAFENPYRSELSDLVTNMVKSLNYEGFSMSTNDIRTSGRLYIEHNNMMKNLSFAYSDFMFNPDLYNYVDAKNMIFYTESSNLAKRMSILNNAIDDEFGDEMKEVLRLFEIMDTNMAFSTRYVEGDLVPRITLMAELKRNNKNKAKDVLENLIGQIKETTKAQDDWYKEMGMENPNQVEIRTIKSDLYEITISLDDDSVLALGVDDITIKFGINESGILIASNDETAGIIHNNARTNFLKNVKGPINSVGTAFIDFKSLSSYIDKLENKYPTIGSEEQTINTLNKLDFMSIHAYAGLNWLKVDFNITYEWGDTLESLLKGLESGLFLPE
ncbi:MAG: hypothetical protein Q8P68_01990 [Candidatus Peregrinibacteria bacterium]|nr:hypothetical protein [Candidatus Peregrinibacteria bacterium]MDZ4244531.1 hypothetical protein [Candidatus Gracilibacteria bacterium]